MLNKIAVAGLFAASALVTMPTAAAADDFEACMLNSGCFYASGDDANPGHWVCPSPKLFMLCLSPDTQVAAGGLTLDPAIKD